MKSLALFTSTALLISACGGNDPSNNISGIPPAPYVVDTFSGKLDPDRRNNFQYLQINVDGRTFLTADSTDLSYTIDPNVIPVLSPYHTDTARITLRDPSGNTRNASAPVRAYRGFFSGIYVVDKARTLGTDATYAGTLADHYYRPTTTEQLPAAGKADYRGYAIGLKADDVADLNYHIDFDKKYGFGSVTANHYHPAFTLNRASLRTFDENGHIGYTLGNGTNHDGSYEIVLSGDEAQEISGTLEYRDPASGIEEVLGLHGGRGHIAP